MKSSHGTSKYIALFWVMILSIQHCSTSSSGVHSWDRNETADPVELLQLEGSQSRLAKGNVSQYPFNTLSDDAEMSHNTSLSIQQSGSNSTFPASVSTSTRMRNLRQVFLASVQPELALLRISNFGMFMRSVFVDFGGHNPDMGRTFPALLLVGVMGIIEFVAIFVVCLVMLAPIFLTMMGMIHFMFKSSIIMLG